MQWIAAVTRGHNGGVCLLKDGEIVFALEEERLSRRKYDGAPILAITEILKYTSKLDLLAIVHTVPLEGSPRLDYSEDELIVSLAKKLGLIERTREAGDKHPQVVDLAAHHHRTHAACAFYRSGFDTATAVVADGAGSSAMFRLPSVVTPDKLTDTVFFEVESIFACDRAALVHPIATKYRHLGCDSVAADVHMKNVTDPDTNEIYDLFLTSTGGITKTYEAVTTYCGFQDIEAGKTMGLFPYGVSNPNIPPLLVKSGIDGDIYIPNRNLFHVRMPQGVAINTLAYPYLYDTPEKIEQFIKEGAPLEVTHDQSRRDLAYAVQTQTQQALLNLIIKAVEITNIPRVVLSGGYALNCVANYFYLEELNKRGIELYVEPISSDAGTAVGGALLCYHKFTDVAPPKSNKHPLYLGSQHHYNNEDVASVASKYGATIKKDVSYSEVIDLLQGHNIVSLFQGSSESGPRALGNRSILFDPTAPDGKDYVNRIKRREYFRPFAGTILAEHAHEWFDMRGLEESPHMMYAMNCYADKQALIPSIIHVDGTCRIQTVTKEQNLHYYSLIKEFANRTGVPILFNTSFNLGGEPLVETLDDAVRTLANSEIEYLFLPEYEVLITLKNTPKGDA